MTLMPELYDCIDDRFIQSTHSSLTTSSSEKKYLKNLSSCIYRTMKILLPNMMLLFLHYFWSMCQSYYFVIINNTRLLSAENFNIIYLSSYLTLCFEQKLSEPSVPESGQLLQIYRWSFSVPEHRKGLPQYHPPQPVRLHSGQLLFSFGFDIYCMISLSPLQIQELNVQATLGESSHSS